MTTISQALAARIEQVRDAITAYKASGPVARYPDDLRSMGGRVALELRSHRWPVLQISQELGASWATLDRWIRELDEPHQPEPSAQGCFLPVRIEPAAATLAPVNSLTLHTPGGWRVEGLTLSDVVTLLRAVQS